MRFKCTIDGCSYALNENADKPLNRILEELVMSFPVNNSCRGANCGNCVVVINGVFCLSCLIPAFKLDGANILTFDGFRKTRACHDIERAYQETGTYPCQQCYAAKTMLIESVLQKLEKEKDVLSLVGKNKSVLSTEFIAKEIGVNSCKCVDAQQLKQIVDVAYSYRSKRSGRR